MIEFFGNLFYVTLTQPLLNALVFLYEVVPGADLGIAIILLTILIRLAFYPLSAKAIRAQKALAELQPKVKELREKFKNDRQQQAQAMMDLYKKEGINPFASMLPILVQLPVLIAVYQLFLNGFRTGEIAEKLYPFIPSPGAIEPSFLGMLSLSEGSLVLAVVAGALQFVQGKQMAVAAPKKQGGEPDIADMIRKQSLFLLPLIMAWIAYTFPGAIGLYLVASTAFGVVQHHFITKPKVA